jgi:L-alanine-DL-glutamate epimerase-like enolase superfamily enzyme
VKAVEVRGVPSGKGLVLPWDPKQVPYDTRDYVMVQFLTDSGLIGTTMDGDQVLPAGIAKTVEEHAQYFIGKDPFELEVHNREFFQKVKAPPVRLFFLEVGLWDIIGKALNQPLYRLWGASQTKVVPYAATVHFLKTPEERAEDALKFYEKGFRAIKVRLHHTDPKEDLKLVATVIKAVKGKMEVMADANMAGKRPGDPPPVWDYQLAMRMALELQDLGLYWLEEPLPRQNYDDLAKIRKQLTKMYLAGGEGNVGLAEYREILGRGSLSYIQPDAMIGGPVTVPVTVIRKMAAMGEAFGAKFGPHHGKSGVGMMINLHMQCAAPNTGYLEYMYDPGYWSPEGFQAGFAELYPIDKEGYIHAPSKPGLGIDWDRTFFRKHGLEWS